MALNPFGTISTYSAMLSKIAFSTAIITGLCTYVLGRNCPTVQAALDVMTPTIEIDGLALPLGLVGIAFAAGLLSRLTRLHDRLSTLLGIRKRFDIDYILVPLAAATGFTVSKSLTNRISLHRSILMRDAFYRYASSGKPEIDHHYISMALDQWSWFWIILEAQLVLIIAAMLSLVFGASATALVFALFATVGLAGLRYSWAQSIRLARDECEQILLDPRRKEAVRSQFDAL